MLYSDLDVALRTVRDLFSSEIDKLWCDDPETLRAASLQFVQTYMPRLRARLTMYQGAEPIFDHFKIEPQIERALDRKVWLKSGGYLVFDQAEALTAIDVNTGPLRRQEQPGRDRPADQSGSGRRSGASSCACATSAGSSSSTSST